MAVDNNTNTCTTNNKKWAEKLSMKISSLAETSSKETLQTVAKWLVFHRKHLLLEFRPVLIQNLSSSSFGNNNNNKGMLVLSVIHEVLLLHHHRQQQQDQYKWERLADMRVGLGEILLLDDTTDFSLTVANTIQTMYWKEWDSHNVFGGRPTLLHQIKKKCASTVAENDKKPTTAEATAAAEGGEGAATTTSKPAAATETKTVVKAEASTDASAAAAEEEGGQKKQQEEAETAKTTTKTRTATTDDDEKPPAKKKAKRSESTAKQLTKLPTAANTAAAATATDSYYDFEATGVPYEKWGDNRSPRALVDACRAIATLQIARDLRSESANTLSSLLSSLPQNVRTVVAEVAERQNNDNNEEQQDNDDDEPILSDDQAREFCPLVSDALLDTDLKEQLQMIQTFAELVQKQQVQRQELLQLLQQSRCQFGSDRVAETYYEKSKIMEKLQNRKQVLADAMELEGLDVVAVKKEEEQDGNDNDINDIPTSDPNEELPPLTWYEQSKEGPKLEQS